ncbi:unnamed protein product [Meganyctiphanes norvegica]|uniref:Otoancorin n=1 Tax=Meganyctiphanes norvegica TaxID=48144 RepID=A0AAV2PFG0_MEGNR
MAAMKHMKPCLDSSQRDAIKGMLLDIKGDASKWTTTDDVSCLLDTLPEGTLNQIPTEVMAQWSCDRNIQGYEDYVANREAQCKYDIGEKEFKNVNDNMKMVEMKALQAALKNLDTSSSQMRRRKRQATSESGAAMCDKAAIGGGNSLETNEIKNMASEDVMSCLADLGQAEITQEKAKALAEKVYMAKSQNLDLTSDEIQSLGYILRGFTADQIMNFSVPTTSSDIAALGIERDLTQEQLTALAKKVNEWKAVENLSSDELKNVNKIVCGFSAAEVEKLKTDSIMKALPTLRDLDDCSSNVTMKLANKAFMKYNETGKITDAMVAELGGLVGNLAPEYINKIPSDAMAGLTVKGMESFTPDAIKSMNIDQIKALPVAAAKALTSNQQSHFNEDMKEALKNGPLKDPNVETKDSGANSFIGSAVLCAFGVSAALQLL